MTRVTYCEAEADERVLNYVMNGGYSNKLPKHPFPLSECSEGMRLRVQREVRRFRELAREKGAVTEERAEEEALAIFGF